MRTIAELGQLLIDNKELFHSGLCCLSVTLFARDIITNEEEDAIDNFIHNNMNLKLYRYGYGFKIGYWLPREKWIRETMLTHKE